MEGGTGTEGSTDEWSIESITQEISKQRDAFRSKQRERLIAAHNSFVDAVESTIKDRIRSAITRGYTSVFILDPQCNADLQGYAWMTIQKGFFNRHTREYSRARHIEAGITQDPIEVLLTRLRHRGVKSIEDVSDPQRGYSFAIRVDW
jgi:hypothetical protein